jgi:urease accessory protein
MTFAFKRTLAVAGLTVAATPALAHTGGTVAGFASGFAHPILGLDHLLAMVAVGVWSAAQPARLAWRGPAVFVAMLGVGALFGMNGISLPFVEPGILASVVILGLMIAVARMLPAALGLVAIGGFALLHGHAHGTEAAGALAGYMTGFLLASALLHGAGYGAGRIAANMRFGLIASGLAIAAGGLVLAGG